MGFNRVKLINIHFFSIKHALPLPGFLLLFSDISRHIELSNESLPLDLPMLSSLPFAALIPRMWLYLLGNVLTQ